MTYETHIFRQLEKIVNDILANIAATDLSGRVNQVETLLLTWFTLYIAAKGFMVLAGKSIEPVRELLLKLVVFSIVVTFATNAGGWLTLVNDAINGLNDWAGFGSSLYAQLDEIFGKAVELGEMIYRQEDEALSVNIGGFFAEVIIFIGFGAFALPAIGIIITTAFVLKILILIGPIMIFTLLFDWFKSIFQKWIELIISNTLTVLLVGVSFQTLTNIYEKYIRFGASQAKALGENGLALSVEIFFVSLILMMLIMMARGIAQQLTYVSIESLPGAAAGGSYGFLDRIRGRLDDLQQNRRRRRRK